MFQTLWFIGLIALAGFRFSCWSEWRHAPALAWLFLLTSGLLWSVLGLLLLVADPWSPAEYIDTSGGGRNGWLANVIIFFHRLGPTGNGLIWGSLGLFMLWALWSGFWWRWAREIHKDAEKTG